MSGTMASNHQHEGTMPMAANTLPKTPQQDEIEFTVLVKTAFAGREVTLRFNFGEGRHVNIGYSGVGELSETQAKRLGNLTTDYVGNLAEVLFHVN
jgi:hypothetical protein